MEDKQAVVIGGGVAGLAAARDLARLGVATTLVERSAFLGGHALQYACKAAPDCQQCSACQVEQSLSDVLGDDRVTVLADSSVTAVARQNGTFHVTLDRRPLLDPARCTDCGLCLAACPAAAEGALVQSESTHMHPRFAIDVDRCLRLSGQSPACQACRDACPVGAINLDAQAHQVELDAAAVVVATGFDPVDGRSKPQLGYGTSPDVMTAVELEARLRTESRLLRPSTQEPVQRVAFVQCVGSRDREHQYCSRVCCAYALRMASALKDRQPETEVSIFYIDLQPVGKCFGELAARYGQNLNLRRTMVGDVYPLRSGELRVTYQDPENKGLVDELFDAVVLSVGIAPAEGNRTLAHMLGAELNEAGFFASRSNLESNLATSPGVVLAGTAEGPRDIADTIAHGRRAAWHVAKLIGV